MTVSTTIYTHTFTIVPPATGYVIPFPINSKSDIQVYSNALEKYVFLTDDYTVSGEGLGGADSFTLTLLDISAGGTYDVHRRTPRTQPIRVSKGSPSSQMETGYDLLALQAQEGMFATIDGFDAKGKLVKKIATPISDGDAATLGYVQSRITGAGENEEMPPVNSFDVGSFLQADSTASVKWGEARQLPSGSNGFLRQDSNFLAAWQAEQTYQPPDIPVAPKWLSQASSTMQWRDILPLPSRTGVSTGATILSDGTDSYWSLQTDIPFGPAASDSYDSAVRWMLTIVDGSIAWKAHVWGTETYAPSAGDQEKLHEQTECIGHGGSNWDCNSCMPGFPLSIGNGSVKIGAIQPHVGGYGDAMGLYRQSVYHGLNMPTEILHGVAYSPDASGLGGKHMGAPSMKITETHIEFIRHEYMIHSDTGYVGGFSNIDIHWAIWADSASVRTSGGKCHV